MGLRVVVSSHTAVEGPEQEQLFSGGELLDGCLQILIELVLDPGRGAEGGSVDAQNVQRARRSGEAKRYDARFVFGWWLYRGQQRISHFKSDGVHPWLPWFLPLPKERVVLFPGAPL